MPKIPNQVRTVSPFIEKQLPAFVREDYPNFIAFVQAYYEWLEVTGIDVFDCKILACDNASVTLTPAASTQINAYVNMNIVCLNGPAKGHTRLITGYDPATNIVTIEPAWLFTNVPLANTHMVIRDNMYPNKLMEYRDIDTTLDRFVDFFRDQFLYNIPGTVLADKRQFLKHIKTFYQARGTENAYKFLFRILFNEELEMYYPKVDLIRASDAKWVVQKIIRTTTTGNTFDYVSRKLTGATSGATANVESTSHINFGNITVSELSITSQNGEFLVDEDGVPEFVKISYNIQPPAQTDLGSVSDLLETQNVLRYEMCYQLLTQLLIDNPGQEYQVGETISITGGGAIVPAKAEISAIFLTYYTGGAQPRPTSYDLKPFFGPGIFVNPDGNPGDDDVCIPGLYFFGEVEFTASNLINANQIILAANTTTQDNFFVGDQITLTAGSGRGQVRTIVSYNGATKIATVDAPFNLLPDQSTTYQIAHNRGGIKAIKILDFGLGFVTTPTVTINTVLGSGAVVPPLLGIVGTSPGYWALGRNGGLGDVPTTTDGMLSSNKVIQDSYYWQDFSYDIHVGVTVDKYRDIVKTLLHPAGMKMFGTVLVKSQPKTDFFGIIRQLFIEYDPELFSVRLKGHTGMTLELDTLTPTVIGFKNKDLDSYKFTGFPPNSTFNTIYPFPNQNYWTPNGPGNTQIQNLANIPLSEFINYPNRRTKINLDAIVKIENADSYSLVGPIGQSGAALAQFLFTGFEEYTANLGNTQIANIASIPLSQLIDDPRSIHSNICTDAEITILRGGQIPAIGDIVEYAFLEGNDPQIVYNVSPNNYTDEMDAVLGADSNVSTDDPAWSGIGLAFDGSNSQIVTATGVPSLLSQCTVVVVANVNSTSGNQALVNSINNVNDNGFAIDARTGGAVSFRAQYDGTVVEVDFPTNTISAGEYFMATLRFDNGLLKGNVNESAAALAQFTSYPINTGTSSGWYFGRPFGDYESISQSPSLFSFLLYGVGDYKQPQEIGGTISVSYLDGNIAYAIFFDRPLWDYEVPFVYTALKNKLSSTRGIHLP